MWLSEGGRLCASAHYRASLLFSLIGLNYFLFTNDCGLYWLFKARLRAQSMLDQKKFLEVSSSVKKWNSFLHLMNKNLTNSASVPRKQCVVILKPCVNKLIPLFS